MTFKTRFAPSPTGPLHLGHAYSSLLAHDLAREARGDFLLRIEDIDTSRARTEWEEQIYEDLAWLGLSWPTPVMRQSEHLASYRSTLEWLWEEGLIFACTCSRRDVRQAASAPQEGGVTPTGPDGLVYPGTCRGNDRLQLSEMPTDCALRLHMGEAARRVAMTGEIGFAEDGCGPDGAHGSITFSPEEAQNLIGDVVLARADMGTSYHLSVVLDDAAQYITHVVRGADLFEATKIHVILQRLLGLPTPTYHHHRLIRDADGKRLAKRDDARAILNFRNDGCTPGDIRDMVGLPPVTAGA